MATKPLEFGTAFAEELAVVRRRRISVGIGCAGQDTEGLVRFARDTRFRDTSAYEPERADPASWPPDRWPLVGDDWIEGNGPRDRPASDNLVGLALSGGGIRSAATCLGAMQALDAKGVMRFADYLSSVSGGGYAAACLNANIVGVRDPLKAAAAAQSASRGAESPLRREPVRDPPSGWIFPFPHVAGIRESVLFRYLRANAQYLIPRGRVREYTFAPVLLLRGLFLNLWAMLPLVLFMSAVTMGLLACPRLRGIEAASEMLGIVAAILGVFWATFFVLSFQMRRKMEGHRDWPGWLMLLVFTSVIAGAIMCVDRAGGAAAFAIIVIVGVLETWRQAQYDAANKRRYRRQNRPSPAEEAQGRATANQKKEASADAGLARESFRQSQAQALLVSVGVLFVTAQPLVAALVGRGLADETIGAGTFAGFATIVLGSTWLGRFEKLPDWARKALLLLAAALVGPVVLWGGSALTAARAAVHGGVWIDADLGLWQQIKHGERVEAWIARHGAMGLAVLHAGALAGLASLLWLINLFLYNANDVSPHLHYRDKLANTFLFSADLQDRQWVTSHSELRLSQMDVATAPFPLINAALNFADRDEYRGRGRDCTFFTFSPLHVGSTEVDYMRTRDLEAVHGHFKLSSAVAVSAAAAAPNAGRATNPALRFLLALVNVRLGYWLPNPRIVASDQFQVEADGNRPKFPDPGAGHLLREMVGAIDTRSQHINLSDGGHLENLGIYELIRRRCRIIIAIDAEQDGAFSFVSLGDLVRFARIDRAVNIDIDVSAIRPDKDGFSKRHAAIGRIDYGRGEYGWLIYIKNSLTGREDESVRKYRAVQREFPHHSTGDQFFDEEQFEAYRALGYHMVTETFGCLPGA